MAAAHISRMHGVPRLLYDLASRDDRVRFSPYCWRIRMALAHKGLDVETVPWRFIEKSVIAFAKTDRVPVLVDGDVVVTDSMDIADYLDSRYPERPLLGAGLGRAHTVFIRHWVESVLFPQITRQIVGDLVQQLHPMDVQYFRSTREKRLGMTLEAFSADRDQHLAALHASLQPMRGTLSGQPFLCGEEPGFADYIVFAAFQWARCGTGRVLLAEGDLIRQWFDRLLSLYGGLGANAPTAQATYTAPFAAP